MRVMGISGIVSNSRPEAIQALWQRFHTDDIASIIRNKVSDNTIAVYTRYQGDHTRPYTLLIGHEVSNFTINPKLDSIDFETSNHTCYTVKGQLPDVVMEKWAEIWRSKQPRAYGSDYDVYKPDGSVDIFVEYTVEAS